VTTVSPLGPLDLPRPEWFEPSLKALVQESAPRVYALVEEFATESGDLNAEVAAWGLVFGEGPTRVLREGHNGVTLARSPESAARLYSLMLSNPVRVIWADGDARVNPCTPAQVD
jgi:hypothetical protein